MDKARNYIGQVSSNLSNDNSNKGKFIKAAIAIVLVLLLVYFVKKIYNTYTDYKNSKPWVLKGTKRANKRMIVLQDPSKSGSTTLGRSKNEEAGLEFTYIFWMFIDDWAVKYGQWKHVMHKGNDSSWPLRGPGIWLHPKDNAMRVYMNTFKEIGEYVDIGNIPINKWFCVSVNLRQKNLDVFINGNLAKRKVLSSLPKQNFGDLFVNSFQGFSGYLSNIRYFDYYISYSEMSDHIRRGPSSMPCVDSNEMTPYLSANWWTNH